MAGLFAKRDVKVNSGHLSFLGFIPTKNQIYHQSRQPLCVPAKNSGFDRLVQKEIT